MPQKFKHLVVDTTAFIKNVQLQELAEEVITIPEVMQEIKHNRQIKRLAVLPYDLKVMKPTPECIQFVAEFAKKTGDFSVLSLTDLTVIALTYQLEKQYVGNTHLRNEPKMAKTVFSDRKPAELIDAKPLAGFYSPNNDKSSSQISNDEQHSDIGAIDETQESDEENIDFVDDLLNKFESHSLAEKFAVVNENTIPDVDNVLQTIIRDKVTSEESEDEDNFEDANEDNANNEDIANNEEQIEFSVEDDQGWITPENIKKVKRDYGTNLLEVTPSHVACITTDYAMQNVLKQIGLQVAALDGRVIKQTRTFILRCYACFKTTTNPSKIFCPACGNKTLKRVAVSLDENGQQVIHINTRRQITAKHKNKSIPAPRGGKHALNPILREDQPIPQQRISAKARSRTNALAEDYIAGFSPFVMRDTDSRSAMMRNTNNIKQWMENYEYDNHRRGYKKFTK